MSNNDEEIYRIIRVISGRNMFTAQHHNKIGALLARRLACELTFGTRDTFDSQVKTATAIAVMFAHDNENFDGDRFAEFIGKKVADWLRTFESGHSEDAEETKNILKTRFSGGAGSE